MAKALAETIRTIVDLAGEGLSLREMARRCGVSESFVRKTLRKHGVTKPHAKPGRPVKLSAQNRRLCTRLITSGQQSHAVGVAKSLHETLGITVSPQTVRNAFKEAGFGAVVKQKRPKLSPKNVKDRLDFALRHKDWTLDDWKRVIWSDETKINRFCSDGLRWCWLRDSSTLQERAITPTMKHGGGSLMLWGCMTYRGVGYACRINGTMDKTLYQSILEDELMRTIEFHDFEANHVIFQHDNDPKHRAKTVQAWLKDQEFDTLLWPSQSPDLNPIEHLWATLKRRLAAYPEPPAGITELWGRVEAEWEAIESGHCQRLIESMPRRIEAVLKARGRWTCF